jgi:hypothetical protein
MDQRLVDDGSGRTHKKGIVPAVRPSEFADSLNGGEFTSVCLSKCAISD